MGSIIVDRLKRVLSIFLSVVLVVGFLPVTSLAYASESNNSSASTTANVVDSESSIGGGLPLRLLLVAAPRRLW